MSAYAEALRWLYSFTDYEASRITPRTDMRLERVRRLMELAGNPQQRFASVHIGGTKGKGSTAAMIASISQAAGLRTGLYTTPHLNTHRERMRIDGQLISRQEFVTLIDWLRDIVARYGDELGAPTTYELGTVLAFQYFADHRVDLAVVEVGLGGRLDATNIIQPKLAAFTSISYDHTDVLGPTLTSIAREKAGIIKPGVPAISAPQEPEARTVLELAARDRNAPISFASAVKGMPDGKISAGEPVPRIGQWLELGKPVWLPLLGGHQLINAGVAVAVARELALQEDVIAAGLENTRWPGRLEILREKPLVVADGAHNVDSMKKLAQAIRQHFRYEHLRVIAGFSADKDIAGMAICLNELGGDIVLVRSKHPRAAELASVAQHFSRSRIAGSLEEALAGQEERALALVTGSLYLVGEAREALGLVGSEDLDPV